MNLVRSECDIGDIAGVSYDEFASIMIVVFFSVMVLVAIRLVANKGHFRTVLKTVFTAQPDVPISPSDQGGTSFPDDQPMERRRSSIMKQGFEYLGIMMHHSEVQNEFINPNHAARRSLAAFRNIPSSQTAPPFSTGDYRFPYSTDDTSFLRKTFFGSVLSDELLWLQPITYGCMSAILVCRVCVPIEVLSFIFLFNTL
jgi:hypothetical protein